MVRNVSLSQAFICTIFFILGHASFCLRICLQCRRPGFDPWVGKIPWRRERPPTLVFWPREFQGLEFHGVAKSWTWLSDFHFYFQDMEATKMSNNRWKEKEVVVHIYKGILLSHKKESMWDSSNELDEPRTHYTEWSESERDKYCFLTHIYTI